MEIEIDERCPHCEGAQVLEVDPEVMDAIMRGESPLWEPTYCPHCGAVLRPCACCHTESTDCSNCPFDKYYYPQQNKESTMTEGKTTPSFEEIQKSFFEKCQLHQKGYPDYMPCPHCEYKCLGSNWQGECNGDLDSQGSCERHYIYAVATGYHDINKPLWNPPKVELPEWCKVGAWVMDDGDLTLITEIDHAYIWGKVADRDVTMMQPIDRARELKPVKFRPYTFEEAVSLLGKTIMGGCDNCYASLITDIFKREGCENEETQINHEPFYEWQEKCVTIDGLPIGVPVVDEELLNP